MRTHRILLIVALLAVACWEISPSRLYGQTNKEAHAAYDSGRKLRQQGKYAEALADLETAMRLYRESPGEDSVEMSNCYNLNGLLHVDMVQYTKAEPLYLSCLKIREAKLGKNDLGVATILNNLANLYGVLGQYARAESLYERCLKIREAKRGKDHPDVAQSLNNLAIVYSVLSFYAKAEPLYLRSLQIRETKLGMDHLDVAQSLNNLANLYRDMGEYAKAEPLYQRSLEIREAKRGKDHPDVAQSLNNLALLYTDMGQHAKAEPLHQRSLEIREKLGKDHPDVAQSLNNLGLFYADTGQYEKAESLYKRALQIGADRFGKDHFNVTDSLYNLANLYRDMGKYASAESLHQRCLQIREATLGKDHPSVAQSLVSMAGLYHEMGQYARAESLHRLSLQIREAKLGKDHPDVAQSLNNLGNLLGATSQYAKAEPLLERSLQIREAKLGKDHPDVAQSLNNLANLYSNMGQLEKAEPLLQRSLQILEARLGKDHPNVANPLNNLARLYRDKGQYAKAEPLYQRSLHIRETQLGKDHRDVVAALNNLADLWARQKDWARAIPYVHRARQGTANHLAHELPSLSEQEQLALLQKTIVKRFHKHLSLGWSARHEATAASAEWLLNGKAVGYQCLAEQLILARDAKEPVAKQLVEDLQQTRARLAALVNRTPSPGQEKVYQKNLQELRAKEQQLAQELARVVGRAYRANPWVTLAELRSKLGPRSVFVEIARFPVWDYNAGKSAGPRYVAWITPPKGEDSVQLIDLGEAELIDGLIEQTRKTLIGSALSITKVGEIEAVAALQKPLMELSTRVLHPLLPTLAKYEEWIVCPDGALWLTPWNALLLTDGKFALEQYRIRHVVSGRDLVLELPKTKTESAYIFADPDYDFTAGKVLPAKNRLDASNLLGQRLRGAIGKWNVSFEFRDAEVIIRDEDTTGAIAGKGTWKLQGDALTLQTPFAVYHAAIDGNAIVGQRTIRNDKGASTPVSFRMARPRGPKDTPSVASTLAALPRVRRLPGTALEAEAVRARIQQWLGQEPQVFLNEKASEAMVKALRNPRVLTLATHGYFLANRDVEAKSRPALETGEVKRPDNLPDKKGHAIENPLLRCGLLLAGCNHSAETKPGEDDGILTGLEIVGMNLNGCELVVLSACETALGDVRNGEGVAGLRQAFQLAGAKGVLASLWQVPDRETAMLINAFYGELTKGRHQAEALRQAQLQRIAARRGLFGAAHPFFWSAFALTSRGMD